MNLEQIRDIRFHKARKGYMPDEVDKFIEEVIVAFEELLNAHAADRQKLAEAEQEVETCRAREHSVGEALMAAQRQAECVIQEAQNRAEEIVSEARAQAETMVSEAEQVVAQRQRAADALMQEATAFKSNLMEIYRHQLALIEGMPGELLAESAENAPEEVLPVPPEAQPEVPVENEMAEESKPAEIPVQTSRSDEEDIVLLVASEDDDEEIYAAAKKNDRFDKLQFGDEYEEPVARRLFRRKK